MATSMENDNISSKKRRGYSMPVIIVTLIVLLAAIGYYYYTNVAAPAPDYDKYLNFISEGDSLVTQNKFTEAKKSYEKSLKYNPQDAAAANKIVRLDSANQLIKTQNYAEAKKIFQVIVNIPASATLSQYALTKAGVTNNPPIKVSVKWKGDVLEITISGGVPFSSESQPYTIEGVSCTDCITWKRDNTNKDNYIADVTGTKIKANKIKMKDKLGQFAYSNVPARSMTSSDMAAKNNNNLIKPGSPGSENKTFAQYVKSGDSLFSLGQYAEAKGEYQIALSTHPGDKDVTKKVVACDEKIKNQLQSEAMNIAKVAINGGTFTMGTNEGNDEDGPAHQVSIGSFSLGKTEVTVEQYRSFCDATGRSLPPAPRYGWINDNPITNITWDEARQYCTWVGGRLPTEAEWEYAASGGGSKTAYSGSNSINRVAVYKGNSGGKPATVGRKSGNNFDLLDMTGNVSEWCADWYGSSEYAKGAVSNPRGPSTGAEKVIRGGAYNSDVNSTQDGDQLKVTYRNSEAPSARRSYIGFRVAWSR